MKINHKRLLDTFLKLVKIDSESFEEKEMQEFLVAELKKIGCQVTVDNAGKKYPTNAKGNVIGFLPGTVKSEPFVLAAHMDTVSPGKGICPVRTGFHDADTVSDAALICLIVCLILNCTLNNFLVERMSYATFDSNNNCLIHLVADNLAYDCSSQISFAHSLILPSVTP